jgi:hypothetical protein
MIPVPEDDDNDYLRSPVDMTLLDHVTQALRLIASRSPAGPVLLVVDDIQLLFHQRSALTEKYDAIPEVFNWLLKAETEGILDVVMCSSEKSAVGAIKRCMFYNLHILLFRYTDLLRLFPVSERL